MTQEIHGRLDATGRRFGLVVGRFNSFVTEKLVHGATDTLMRHGARDEDIVEVRVPGAMELPVMVRKLAESKRFDAVIALGCVIRGQTPHFDYVAAEAAKGVASVALHSNIPVAFGVLTCDTVEQAIDRAGGKAGNKGADAAMTAIEMIDVYGQLDDAGA